MNLGKAVLTDSFRVFSILGLGFSVQGTCLGFTWLKLNLTCNPPVPAVTLSASRFLPTFHLGTGWC